MAEEYMSSAIVEVVIASFASFLICLLSIPIIIDIANKRKLFDYPNSRSSHTEIVPRLGGVGIMFTFIVIFLLIADLSTLQGAQYIIISLFILFMLGIKDDMSDVHWFKKLIAQLIAVCVTVTLGGIYFTSFHGFLGIGQINYSAGLIVTVFAFMLIINSYNLIDGIDGLASGMGILALGTLGIWFFMNGEFNYALMALSFAGSLAAFFYFNVYGKRKLFMGDTGALILGYMVTVVVIKFNEMNIDPNIPYRINSSPAISVALLFVPIYDTFRVFILRLVMKRSPFKADRLHLHHYLIEMGITHARASTILIFTNILISIIAFLLRDMGTLNVLLIIFIIGIGLNLVLLWRLRTYRSMKIQAV